MPGARCARSLACKVKSTQASHHGHTGITRHSPRNGFNGFLRALPGDRAFLSPSPRKIASAKLDAGVEASGPHDFAVRGQAPSSEAPLASTASRLHVRDDRETPLEKRRDANRYISASTSRSSEISENPKLVGRGCGCLGSLEDDPKCISSWPGSSGHPRLLSSIAAKTWMPGTRPGMTTPEAGPTPLLIE
jgi:hypothetical protein